MRYILTAGEAGAADRAASGSGLPPMVLMERAALSVVECMDRENIPTDRVLVVAGTGNNGGDGIAIARLLFERGERPLILLSGSREKMSGQTRNQMEILSLYHPVFTDHIPEDRTVIVDALFGTGLHRPIEGERAALVDAINRSRAYKIAVDIPSGIHSDTGKVCGTAVRADMTVTFSFAKRGHYFYPGSLFSGVLKIMPIGITPVHACACGAKTVSINQEDLKCLPVRDESGNKGTFGKVLVIAGSRDIFGAAFLAAKAALKTGVGMVKVFTDENNRVSLAASLPEALMSFYRESEPESAVLSRLSSDLDWADTVLVGPGIGKSRTAQAILLYLLQNWRKNLVMDADALNLMAGHRGMWHFPDTGRVIITPHIMEMSRLCGFSAEKIKEDPAGTAAAFASEHRVVCVLKDATTVTASPDGRVFLNTSGNSALATAGSGDVLSGIAAGLFTWISRGQDASVRMESASEDDSAEMLPAESFLSFRRLCRENQAAASAALAVYLHGLCGEKAAESASRASVTASEIIDFLHFFL
ncbi:MAG: NAD(P)H-hydrate dehydratase [Bilifractor sp.]|jgi:hydroxyethylthiazole kinase-like uncharacterized protein yjeF